MVHHDIAHLVKVDALAAGEDPLTGSFIGALAKGGASLLDSAIGALDQVSVRIHDHL